MVVFDLERTDRLRGLLEMQQLDLFVPAWPHSTITDPAPAEMKMEP